MRAHFSGDLANHIGEEVVFPFNVDEEGNPWAGPPVLSNTNRLTGTIHSWKGTYGFIHCDDIDPFEVYLHANAAKRGKFYPDIGVGVTFSLHVRATGSRKPQASSPKPADGVEWGVASYGEPSSKRPKLAYECSDGKGKKRTKGKGKWDDYAYAKGSGEWDGAREYAAMQGKAKGKWLAMMSGHDAWWPGDAWVPLA